MSIKKQFSFLMIVFCLIGSSVTAATWEWVNLSLSSNNWNDPLNWIPPVGEPFSIPDADDAMVELPGFAVTPSTLVVVDGTFSVDTLLFGGGAGGNKSFLVTGGTLEMSGGITVAVPLDKHELNSNLALVKDIFINQFTSSFLISGNIFGSKSIEIKRNFSTEKGQLVLSGVNDSWVGKTIISGDMIDLVLSGAGTLGVNPDLQITNSSASLILETGIGTRSIDILNGIGRIFLINNNVRIMEGSYSGIISGTGSLIKNGSEILILNGANTYSGGTTVSAGTLAGTTAGLQGTILNNATVEFDQNTNGTYSSVMRGAGDLIKSGTGTLTLSGANTYTGATTIDDTGAILISATGVLGVASNLTINSTGSFEIASGQTIGTLNGALGTTVNLNTKTLETAGGGSYAGVILGSGGITKSGTGTLTLSGANTYTGATTIEDTGAILISATGVLGIKSNLTINNSGSFEIASDQTIGMLNGTLSTTVKLNANTLTTSGDGSYSGGISGSGGIIKSGAGTLTLGGVNTYTGPTTVAAGTLSLNGGSLETSSLTTIDAPGTFTGNGTLGTTINNGTVNPGASVGIINIIGDFIQGPSGNLIIEIDHDGNRDQLLVTGTATLAGTFTADPQPGHYQVGDRFKFLTANSISGVFDSLPSTSPLHYFIDYQDTFAELIIEFSSSVLPVPIGSLKGNARAVADYLFCPGIVQKDFSTDPDFITVLRLLLTIPADQFADNLPRLSPVLFGALPLANLHNQTLVADTIAESSEKFFWCDRCKFDQKDKEQCVLDVTHTRLWLTPIGNFYRQERVQGSIANLGQFAFNTDTYGFTLGGSHLFFKALNFSAGAGYTHSKIQWKEQVGKGDWDSVYIGPSIGWIQNNAYVNLIVLGSYNHYIIDRKIKFPGLSRTANNHHNSYDLLTRIDGGYKFKVYIPGHKDYFFVLPEIRLSYLNIYEGNYTETGAKSLNLVVNSKHTAFFKPYVLIKFLKDFYPSKYCITPTLQIGWTSNIPLSSDRYTSKFNKLVACEPDFTVQSFRKATHHLSLGAELVIRKIDHFLLEFGYEVNFFDNIIVQHGKIKIGTNF
ncbi:MAG: Extracellular serine protease [Chlamydiae bacterium]|nr:Extracellular serine protease [Chlamydiota bacterium]